MEAQDTKVFCSLCHLLFGLAEKRVPFNGKDVHVDCKKKEERKLELRQLLIRHNGPSIAVVPRGRG